jgi:hypothetical protein
VLMWHACLSNMYFMIVLYVYLKGSSRLSPETFKERLLALVRDLFTFSSKIIKMFILV